MTLREKAVELASQYLGDPYEWAGDGVGGIGGDNYDCSGFMLDILQATGIVPQFNLLGKEFDTTADGLKTLFNNNKTFRPQAGCLGFYGKDGKATHVVMFISRWLVIGAHGGDISKITVEKPNFHKYKLMVILDPYKED